MNGQTLKGIRVMRGKIQKDCANATGLSISQYALKEQGMYEFTVNEALMVANYLHMSEGEANAVFFDNVLTKT